MKPRHATVRVLNENTTEFDGPGIPAALRALDVPYMRSRFGKGYLCPARHTEDVMAWLEVHRYRIDAIL